MALPVPPSNYVTPIPNNPFYSPESNYIKGEYGPFIIGTGLSLDTATGTISATGGGSAGVTSVTAGPGIAVSGATGDIIIANTGVLEIVAGSGISISAGTGTVIVTSTAAGGTVTNINTGTGLIGGPISTTGTIALDTTGVIPTTYINPTLTVNAQGQIVAAADGTAISSLIGTSPIAIGGLPGATPTISINAASTSSCGAVQLSDSILSTSSALAATSKAVNDVYNLVTASVTSVGVTSPIVKTGTATAPIIGIQAASTSQPGAVQLEDTLTSTSTSLALTAAQGNVLAGQIAALPPNPVITGTAPVTVTGTALAPVIGVSAGSTTASGVVQLYNGVDSTSTSLALTAAQGKNLQDQITTLLTTPGIDFAGTIDASTGFVSSVTSVGTTAGYTVGSVLPAADATTVNTYVIVTAPGTFTPPGGSATTAGDGDWFLASEVSVGVYSWQFLNVGFDAPPATTTTAGIVCLSTNALAQAGTDATTALTPAAAAAAYVPLSGYAAKGNLLAASATNTPVALTVGTDGQVLVACSTSATGLCWSSAAAPAIPCACITGKGALVSGTAANTPVALTVGSDGQVLTACAACSTGLTWAPAATPSIPCACITAKGTLVSGTAANTPTALAVGAEGEVLTVCGSCPTGLTWAPAATPSIPCACVTGKGAIITGTAANTPTALTVGTNGQILAANSACAEGLEWIAGSFIPCCCITAKGTLVSGTAASTPTALPVGTDGQVLTVCTACTTGLTWAAATGIVNLYPVIRNANYTYNIPSPNFTKIVICYNEVICDSTGWYDASTGIFKPTVPGFYQINASARVFGQLTNAEATIAIECNTNSKIGIQDTFGLVSGTASALTYMNGSTDQICVTGYIGNNTGSNALNIDNARFSAILVQSQVAPTQLCGDTPVGAINWFGSQTAPSGWLVADGSAISRTGYAALFAVVGTTYGAGDGSTTFNLPDLRGVFLRGWDSAGGTPRNFDPGRAFGTLQGCALQAHCHEMQVVPGGAGRPEWLCPNVACPSGAGWPSPTGGAVRSGGFTGTTGVTETRPTNVALLPCIKWATTIAPANPSSCGIPCSTLVSKGTIITATAPNTPVALPPGTNGQYLIANSACAEGVQWATPNTWISAGTVQSVGISATATAPTVGTTVRNNVRYRQLGPKEWEVQATLFQTGGGLGGNGYYLLTLPAGLQFDISSPYQAPYTAVPDDNLAWMSYGLINSYARASQPGASSYQQSSIFPYDSTRYRIMFVGTGTDFWRNGYYTLGNYTQGFKWGFKFDTP